ncbi:TLD protein [Besnoitia besnoiti]|uniref:Oxidation resistance protein 1 n=1 Tax=Besnoitia besnoiti TaxID=94643 RepID=A0A2A9M896_BESBE|nr:TLD protein [Besnoitia besnoiti]PFH31867.1 TLD protein [Besnoitia besnoiti]
MGDSSSKFSHASPALSYQRLSQDEVHELVSSFGLNEFSPAKARISLHSFLRLFPPVLHPTAAVLLPVLRDVVRVQQLQARGWSSSSILLTKFDSSGQLSSSKLTSSGSGGCASGLKGLGNVACSAKGARKGEETNSGGTYITLQEIVDAVSACAYGDKEEVQLHMLQRLLSRFSKILEEQNKRQRQQGPYSSGSRYPDRAATSHHANVTRGRFALHHHGGATTSTASPSVTESLQTVSGSSQHSGPGTAAAPAIVGAISLPPPPLCGIEAVLQQVFVSAYLLFLAIISPSNPIFSATDPFVFAHMPPGGPCAAHSQPADVGSAAAGGTGERQHASAPRTPRAAESLPRAPRARSVSPARARNRGAGASPQSPVAESEGARFHGQPQARQPTSGGGMSGWDTSSSTLISLPSFTPLDFSFLLNAFATSPAGCAAGLSSKSAEVSGPAGGGGSGVNGPDAPGSAAAAAGAGTGGGAAGAPGALQSAGGGGSAGNSGGMSFQGQSSSKQQQQDALLWLLQILPILPTLFVTAVRHFLLGPVDPEAEDGAPPQQPTLQYQVYAQRRRRSSTMLSSPRRGSRTRANSQQNERPSQRSSSLDTICHCTGGWRGDGPLDSSSKIFTDETAVMLRLSSPLFAFPPLIPWRRLYSSWKQGASFNRICSSVFFYDAPTVLIVKTKRGPILGALISVEWKDAGHVFFGDSNCFLFSLEPQFQIISYFSFAVPSGLGRNFVYVNVKNQFYPKGIGFGGQSGCFRLWIGDEFQNCYCTKSDATYGPGLLLPPKKAVFRHRGPSLSTESIGSSVSRRTDSLGSDGKGPGCPAGANGASRPTAAEGDASGDYAAEQDEEKNAFQCPFEVHEVEVWGCGDAATRQQQLIANKRQDQLRQERRQVDKGRFAQNDFDREFLLENTFNRAKGADAPST